MTTAQSIESQDINVGGVFQSFYAVPDYQREYVWKAEQVEQPPDVSLPWDRSLAGKRTKEVTSDDGGELSPSSLPASR